MNGLSRKLTGLGRWQGTALALSFVVGSGILILPILGLQIAGPQGSLYAWLMMTLIGVPLIAIFYKISSNDSEFTLTKCFRLAFGKQTTDGAKLTILAALIFGMPAMIFTTAGVMARLFHLSDQSIGLLAHGILTVICLNHLRALKKSSQISIITAAFLILLITIAVSSHLGDLHTGVLLVTQSRPKLDHHFLQACTLTFFGYVGWESIGFFSNELRDSKRDLKYVYWISFTLVSLFYLTLAAVVSGAATNGKTFGLEEGILSLLPVGIIRSGSSLMVSLLLLANLNAWIFGGIKQMQEVAETVRPKKRALLAYYVCVSFLLLLLDFTIVDVTKLFLLSNQSWILVYGGILVYYFKKAKSFSEHLIGVVGGLSFILLLSGCSILILLNFSAFLGSFFYRINSEHPLFSLPKG